MVPSFVIFHIGIIPYVFIFESDNLQFEFAGVVSWVLMISQFHWFRIESAPNRVLHSNKQIRLETHRPHLDTLMICLRLLLGQLTIGFSPSNLALHHRGNLLH